MFKTVIMYDDREVVCLILARGGSKGLPHKNILILSGKPLIAHSIDIAKKVKYIDKIYVSTEDEKIKEISLRFGASVIDRPLELATDTASYLEAVKHMIRNIPAMKKNTLVVLLETTSPIRKVIDVEKCIELYDDNIDCVASVSNVKVHPTYMYVLKNDFLHHYLNSNPLGRRQLIDPIVAYNGSIFVASCDFILNQIDVVMGGKMKGYVLDDVCSFDIDTKLDFNICEFLMECNQT